MGNTMPATTACAQCSSHNVVAQRPDTGTGAWGDEGFHILKCLDCGGKTYFAMVSTHTATTYNNSSPKITKPDKAMLDAEKAVTEALKRATSSRTYITPNPFEECDERELSEIAVALELLMEHPAAKRYLESIQSDLNKAIADKG